MYFKYDVIVVGAGHAGCEAASAAARMGSKTMLITMDMNKIAQMSCNPAVGGIAKGQIVREIDALGGQMGIVTDRSAIQYRLLNQSKGPAMWSPRSQSDRKRFIEEWVKVLSHTENLNIWQDIVTGLIIKDNKVCGVKTALGIEMKADAIVLTNGTFLNGLMHCGKTQIAGGRISEPASYGITEQLVELGIRSYRMKTGTPARIDARSIHFDEMVRQDGDNDWHQFSYLNTVKRELKQMPCWITYTNAQTHRVILDNINRSAMYSGLIRATGTRYCPSIEDKLVRFADKDRHQLFIEPEGLSTDEMYVQGMSTSLPIDVQRDMLRTIPGLTRCHITRYGYAIEYDCIDPLILNNTLMCKSIGGLFFAGQINGSSGYEEAAAQGLYAGINAALWLKGEEPLLLSRADAYIGVLCDDLTGKGTNEPYRMMTSRAEYRLLLRQDNADERLTRLGMRTGLISSARYDRLMRKEEEIARARKKLASSVPPDEALVRLMEERGEIPPKTGIRLSELLRRRNISYTDLLMLYPDRVEDIGEEAREQVELNERYSGYIEKEKQHVAKFSEMENTLLPQDIDYASISGLRIEARQKLASMKPESLGRAGRISGVSPADVAVLMIWLKRNMEQKDDKANA